MRGMFLGLVRIFLPALLVGVGLGVGREHPLTGATLAAAGVVVAVVGLSKARASAAAVVTLIAGAAAGVGLQSTLVFEQADPVAAFGQGRTVETAAPTSVDEAWQMSLDFAEEHGGSRRVSSARISLGNVEYLTSSFTMENGERVRGERRGDVMEWTITQGVSSPTFDGDAITSDLSGIAQAVAADGYGQSFSSVTANVPNESVHKQMSALGYGRPASDPVLQLYSADRSRPWRAEAGPGGELPHTFYDPQDVEATLELIERILTDAGIDPQDVDVARIDTSPHLNTQGIVSDEYSTIDATSGVVLAGNADGRGFILTVEVGAFPRWYSQPSSVEGPLIALLDVPKKQLQELVEESAHGRVAETAWSFTADGKARAQTAGQGDTLVDKQL